MASKSSDWIRFAGFVVMLTGGWINMLWLVAAGFLIILFVWTKGLIFGKPGSQKSREMQHAERMAADGIEKPALLSRTGFFSF